MFIVHLLCDQIYSTCLIYFSFPLYHNKLSLLTAKLLFLNWLDFLHLEAIGPFGNWYGPVIFYQTKIETCNQGSYLNSNISDYIIIQEFILGTINVWRCFDITNWFNVNNIILFVTGLWLLLSSFICINPSTYVPSSFWGRIVELLGDHPKDGSWRSMAVVTWCRFVS